MDQIEKFMQKLGDELGREAKIAGAPEAENYYRNEWPLEQMDHLTGEILTARESISGEVADRQGGIPDAGV